MTRGAAEIASQRLAVPVVERRRLEERIGVRFPSLLVAVTRAWDRLPPSSRSRQALLRRMVQLGVAAANRRDFEAMFALYDPAVELIVPPDLVAVGFEPRVQGREERIRFEHRWRTEWGDFRYAPEEVTDLGDRVFLIGYMKGTGASSGAAFDNEWAVLFTVSGGRAVREEVFLDHAEALAAAGLARTTS